MSIPRGILAAALTPFDAAWLPDAGLAAAYYARLLQTGCDGLNVLGTTGEAMSVGLNERLAFMQAIAPGLPRERVMVGTGACALSDAVELTRAAIDLGFAAALIVPPFYYRDICDDNVTAFFDTLFARTDPPPRSVMLYNFPRLSGIEFHPRLVARLLREFPGVIGGVKDSSNKPDLERDLHALDPSLAIFPGSEALLSSAREDGLAGCISGSVCLWAAQAKKAWETGEPRELERVAAQRDSLEGKPLIAAVRARVAAQEQNPAWLRSAPPLSAL